jgi:hypothetical protein
MKSHALLLAAAAVIASAPAAAWNGRGHMIVAAKAWQHLTPRSRARAARLLRHNPMYAGWVRGVPAADRGRVAFIQAATWPDDIKSPSAGYATDRVTGPNANRNSGHDDCNEHRYWHYKDLPFSPDGTALEQPPQPNAETQITLFASTIADPNAGDELKAYDLAWLLHLVGDVHQPLHATSRYIAADPDGDGGGNDVLVCLTAGCRGSALHSFWDGAFGSSENVASVIAFAGLLPAPPAAEAAVLAPAAWMSESLALAQSEVYRAPIGNGLGPYLLTPVYRTNAQQVTSARAALAGVRLANLINRADLRVRGDRVQRRTCP